MPTVDSASHCPPEQKAPDVADSIGDLARDTSAYVRAWSTLVVSETRLARISAVRLVFAALIFPALALVICTTLNCLLAAVLNRWLHDWTISIGIMLLVNLTGLCGLLVAMRRWWCNLSFPRSRGALAHLLEQIA